MTFPPPASRNAPCPCGSGKRYKECHGALVTAAAPPSLEDVLRAALAAHQAARLDEAAALYDRALALQPGLFDALHMRGVVEMQRGRFDRAVELIGEAAALRPDIAEAQRNLKLARSARERSGFEARYQAWVERVERPRIAARAPLRRAAAARAEAPRIAVLLPTYDTREDLLRDCIDSVLAQEWPHWELCIADDASPSPHVRRMLEACASSDERIRVTFRAANGHIAAASNSALALVSAPYVALLDHDDMLPPHALAEIALELAAHPDAAIVYSDEDKVDEHGRRFEPYFKPDWNPQLLLAQNYVSHLGVYRTALLREVGGFREGTEGAQDWDLLLRCAERVPAAAIRHVPQMLYRWRATATSTATSMDAKSYAARAQEHVVLDAYARRGVRVALRRAALPAFLEADVLHDPAPRVSLVLLAGDGGDVAAWRGVAGGALADVAVVTVRDARPDGATRTLDDGAAQALNDAAARANGDVLVFADARHRPPAADRFAAWAAQAAAEDSGPVGATIVDANGDVAGGWTVLDPRHVGLPAFLMEPARTWGMAGRGALVQNVGAVRGDAMAVRRSLFVRLGGWSSEVTSRWHDVDFCLRAAADGALPLWDPRVVVTAATPIPPARAEAPDPDADWMRRRWDAALAHDPAYPDALTRGPRWFDLPDVA
ncbi:MAG TPA: glycosyltransferase [Casimicrobiaceae bacterium]|nr:glycosyltransferase [Casimicrobiaceae bacterium]